MAMWMGMANAEGDWLGREPVIDSMANESKQQQQKQLHSAVWCSHKYESYVESIGAQVATHLNEHFE